MSGNRDPRNDNEKRLAQSRQDSPDRIDDLAETIDHTKPEQDSTIDLPNQTGLPTSFGRYVVREARGRGGFGAVYLGFDPELQRQVAIKVPHLAGASDAQVQEILQEARRLAALSHPGIVTVYDVGVQDGMCYIVSDYVDGMSLAEWLKRNQPRWQQAATIAAELAEALAHAHAFRTIHRDVKPGNIILKDNKTPVLVDFGLAISDPSSAALERGHVSGTPQFMSPEQAAGKGHRIDGRTDIYALGIVLYCMLCQRMPFESDSVTELLRQVREDEPQPPRQLAPEIPAELERICLKAISKHISDRYTTAADMALELRAVLEAHPDSVPAAPVASPPPETSTKRLRSSVRRVRQAERRHVTVLYCECDFFNSAAFLENLDPEEQHELLGDYQQACDEVISRYGGTVVQSTGHGMLVCLGYPTAYEDSARRAVHSGLELIEAVERLNDRLASVQIQLTPWVGIHTGVVIAKLVTDGSSPEPMSLVGEARSVATQLKVAAAPLSVVITQSTQLLISGFFVCESLGQHSIESASRPIEVLRVLHKSEAKSRIDVAEPAGLTPLVGRDMELGILHDRWDHASEGMGQVVLLIGDAGFGKSRLVHELRQHVLGNSTAPSTETTGSIVEWRCSPYFQNSSFYPAISYLERLLDYQRGDTPAERLEKLVVHLQQHGLADKQNVPLLASLLSVPLDERFPPLGLGPQRLMELRQQALLDLLSAYAKQQPVLFIVEDLHWVDPTTLELIGLLVDQGLRDRTLTLLTFRPEFSTPWTSMAHQTQIALNRLTRQQVGELMCMKTGVNSLPDDLVAQVVNRTDGVPLFVEEFTGVIREASWSRDTDGQLQLPDSFNLDSIPNTLQDLLVSRLDRMESAHDLAQLAATVGREFSYELLAAVCDLNESALKAELDKLVQSELLFQKGRPPQSSYVFKHALIQDAAYQSLLKKERQQFHRTIADVLENNFPETAETQPELLARHYTEAGETEKGVHYWLKAGQHAQQRSANTEAISHLTRGLELLETLDESPQRDQLELGLQTTLGPVLMAARGWSAPEVGTAIERAQQLVSKIGALEDQFFVMWGLWGWRIIRADMDICQGIADDIMQLVEKSSEGSELLSEAYWVVGCTAYYKGDFKTGLDLLEKGIALIDDEKERLYALKTGQRCSLMCRSHTALALWELGFPDQALQRADETIRLGKELDHPFSLAMGLFFRRQVLEFCGLRDQARASIEEEYNICREGGFVFFEVHAIFGRGDFLLRQGKVDEARELFDLGMEMLKATGGNLSMDHPYRNIAEAYLLAGLHDDAKEWLNRGFDLVNNRNERGMESEFLRLQGDLALAAGDQTSAEESYQRAVEVARQQQARSWELRAMISFAELRHRQGNQSEARQMLGSTYSFFTEGFETADLVRAKALLNEPGAEA